VQVQSRQSFTLRVRFWLEVFWGALSMLQSGGWSVLIRALVISWPSELEGGHWVAY
jgi:sugar phosphate permease